MRKILLLPFLLFTSCSTYYLSIKQQKVDPSYLASTHVNTPDPRKEHPPHGQKLIVHWQVPQSLMGEHPYILLHVIYRDYTEAVERLEIDAKRGYTTYALLGEEYEKKKGILTYKADLMTAEGKVYREWKHQLWVNLIALE